jgi:hypothetical protein
MDAILRVVNALRFHDRSAEDLKSIRPEEWPAVLEILDRAHLTLALGVRCRDFLPERVRIRIDADRAANGERYDRLVAAQAEITDALAARDVEYVVLKGLSQWPYYCDDPRDRPQYDIDIYVPSDAMSAATETVRTIGYETVNNTADPGADHLPVMIRRTDFTWRGDFFDPEMPPSLELHFRFWNPHGMRFYVGDVRQFWRRRRAGRLDPTDGLTYSALHLVRHLLTGDLHLRHVYEIAHFLERSCADESFWAPWKATGVLSCRAAEGIAFRLAAEWFHCRMHPAARQATEELPEAVKRWFRLFGCSPALITGRPNKNELWLHLCLVKNARDRRAIARQRLFPTRHSRVISDASALAQRSLHHLRTLGPTVRGAYVWWRGPRSDHTQPPETSLM